MANSQQFSLNPNDLGTLKNSVNLMTSQVGFPMTLASLQGRGGLHPQVTLSYSSAGVQEQVNTWNRTAPTGIVGLSWTFDYPRIVSEHQGTVARDDDTYYFMDNGTSIELICTDSDVNETNHYRTHKPRDFRKWTIKFYYSDDIYGDLRWVVTTEAGLEYHYATPQHMVAWGNWIGTSAKTTGQSQHEYAWNLTEIVNRWGDTMRFSYLSEEEAVGNGGMTHTKSSLLERIESPTGNYLQLIYADKYTILNDGLYCETLNFR
ncbi:MAG: SpvB/TcaC N-terminal domain-containing protein [Bacteroidota bacterium]